jgi:hypothetical protein
MVSSFGHLDSFWPWGLGPLQQLIDSFSCAILSGLQLAAISAPFPALKVVLVLVSDVTQESPLQAPELAFEEVPYLPAHPGTSSATSSADEGILTLPYIMPFLCFLKSQS